MAPRYCTPEEAARTIGTTDAVGFGLGPANPDAFLAALGDRDDWVDLTFGGALLLGFYPVLSHPNVTYRCGFFGPAERMMLAASDAMRTIWALLPLQKHVQSGSFQSS